MTPRPYQQQIVSAVQSGWREYRKQLVSVPTGGGKTCIFAWLAQQEQGRTLILAHREELIDQAIDKIRTATGIVAGKEKAEFHASRSASVVVASVQSMLRRLDNWPSEHFSLVVADEAHHAISNSWQQVLKHFDPHAKILGVTATPDRGDKRNLGEYFQNIAAEVSLFDLINQGYLSKIAVHSVPLRIDLSNVGQSCGDFSDRDLGATLDPYLGQIAQAIKMHAEHHRTLAFLPLIATSNKFVEACRGAGLSAEHVDGESPDRREILDRFAGWEFDVLSNAMLLTEGFDDPSIDCIVVLRPTRSRPLYAQMVGRGTRIDPLKENLLLLDFLWMHTRHSVTRPAHLIAQDEAEAEAITELSQQPAPGLPADVAAQMPLDLQGLASTATAQREESLRKQLAEHKNKAGKFISAEQFAIEHNSLVTAEYEPVMKWERGAISEKQAKYLKRAGIDLATVRGKGHASKLLSIYFGSKPIQLATPGQRRRMAEMGHHNAEHATAAEARQFFAELRQ